MQGMFAVVAVVVAAAAVAMGVQSARRRREMEQAWAGLTAQGRCVGVRTTRDRDASDSGFGGVTRHFQYEFTTADGRVVRFEELGPLGTAEGDTVTVRYSPDRPERATAFPPRDRARGTAGRAATFGVLALVAAAAAVLAVVAG